MPSTDTTTVTSPTTPSQCKKTSPRSRVSPTPPTGQPRRRGLRIVVASYGRAQLDFVTQVLTAHGHTVIAQTMSRSMRPNSPLDPDMASAVKDVAGTCPAIIDLMLPASAEALSEAMAGYRPDLLIVYGFNWRLPAATRDLPYLGTLNIHGSLLPSWRGPAPVPQAILAGETDLGLSIHRMNEHIDAGPVLAQSRGITIPWRVLPADVWHATQPVLARLLPHALHQLIDGAPGQEQDEAQATWAPMPTLKDDCFTISTWHAPRAELHRRIRLAGFLNHGLGPIVELDGKLVRATASSLDPAPGPAQVQCADGPLWLTDIQQIPDHRQ
ncbi:hypothetical protein KIH74_34975 [Kineosporia sp. J2-2]|uniref:Formyl transferase N-terminal domain-containing protein n=1 Tax=Kineosporia corallincola TaxID=2835133 RepID=A0ABS5TTS1_9ACTN|nr:formyltransferase family protein [Kineosporia corallincola]MBT0774201.1 hypothetical protein [Kineosporia corallincola]